MKIRQKWEKVVLFWGKLSLLDKALKKSSECLSNKKPMPLWAKIRLSIWAYVNWRYWLIDRPRRKKIDKLEKKLGLK